MGDGFRLVRAGGVVPKGMPFAECSMPRLLAGLHPGMTVWIDEGSLGATVVAPGREDALLEVTHASPKGFRLRADKALNVPDLDLTSIR